MSPAQQPPTDIVLASLAIIRANFDYGSKSYLDNFVPFALDAVRHGGQLDYSDADVAHHIWHRFGLNIPPRVVASILGRAARHKLGTWRDNRFALSDQAEAQLPDIGSQQATLKREQAALVDGMVQYAKKLDATMTPEDAESALLDYIEAHAVPLLTQAVQGGTYAENLAPEPDEPATAYVVAAYIAHIARQDPIAFEQLEGMVKGSMLAAALYLPAGAELDRKFHRTTIYLDTPILIKVLGYDGEDAERATFDVIRLARAQGAAVACFEHSATELRSVMDGAIPVLKRNGAVEKIRRIDRHFLDQDFTESDVRMLMERIPDNLRKHRIDIHAKPRPEEWLTVDEIALEDELQRSVGYRRRPTLLHDLDSITAVHRLRGGGSPARLEDCRAVLVTDNWHMAAASRAYFRDSRHEWPLVMLDHELAALLWVKTPAEAPDLPRRQIIADCLAALQPSKQFWNRYVEVIDQLKKRTDFSDDDLALLRYSGETTKTLMDMTRGDASAVSPVTVETALEAARAAAAAPAAAAAAHAQDELAAAQSTVAGLENQKREATDRVESLSKQVGVHEDRERSQRAAVKERADTIARRALNTALLVLLLLLAAGAVVAGFKLDDHATGLVKQVIRVTVPVVVLGTVLGLGVTIFGGSVRSWTLPLQRRLSRRIERRRLQALRLD